MDFYTEGRAWQIFLRLSKTGLEPQMKVIEEILIFRV